MKVIIKLAISQLKAHWVRTLIASCALIASVSLVVVMIGGFAVTLDRATDVAKESFGLYDLIISAQGMQIGFGRPPQSDSKSSPSATPAKPQGSPTDTEQKDNARREGQGRPDVAGRPTGTSAGRGGASFDQAFIESLRSDPMIASIYPVSESRVMVRSISQQDSFMGSMAQLTGTNNPNPPDKMSSGKWLDLANPSDLNVVIDSGVAKILNLELGDSISLEVGGFGIISTGRFVLKIIGITDQAVQVRGMGSIYVTPELFANIAGHPARINKILVSLKEGTDVSSFEKEWQSKVSSVGPFARVLTPEAIEHDIADSMNMQRAGQFSTMKYVSGIISILAAVFIIFTTLNMGVRESSRQFAMLRAIGMTRTGVSKIILFEGFIFALIGAVGGLFVGWLILHWTMRMPGEAIVRNVPLESRTVIIAIISSFGATLVATIIPIISAIRNRPLEAMLPVHFQRQKGLPWVSMVIGLVLIAFALMTIANRVVAGNRVFALPFFQFDLLSFPLLLIGFVLITPLIIIIIEKIFTPILCFIFRLDRRLLSQQLSSNVWRTVGTAVAMMIGLGLYVTMQTWGHSMMIPFSLPDRSPDMIVTFVPDGIPLADIDRVKDVPGVKQDELIPMFVEQLSLSDDITSLPELKNYWMGMASNIMLFGCDIERTITNDQSMLTSKFIRGNKEEAIKKVKAGGHCIITDQLYIRAPKHFDVGKTIAVKSSDREIKYKIAGIVKVNGWHWITKMSRMRKSSGRTAAIAFVPYEVVANDFHLEKPNVFWFNLDDNINKELFKAKIQEIAQLSIDKDPSGHSSTISGEFGLALDISDLKAMFNNRSNSVLWLLSRYPLYALAISSLGVVNAIMASVWARRWEMGVLRSIGLSRSQLFRLVLIEALLIGLTACALSFVFGVIESWAGIVVTGYNMGVSAEFIIPWAMLSIGFVFALILCMLASIWPAWSTIRREPLQLLQVGRASM